MSDEARELDNREFWKWVEAVAKRVDQWPDWKKGGTSEREQCEPKTAQTSTETNRAHKK